MVFINSYNPPMRVGEPNNHRHTTQAEYDFNYVFEVKTLQSDRVQLRPLVPSLHAQLLLEGVSANPELLTWLGTSKVWSDVDEVCEWIENVCRQSPASLHYAIFSAPLDRLDAPVEDYVFAGTLGMIESSFDQMMSEPGWIIILPSFQRTHVLTHSVGLVMHRILDPPEAGGLGLRRCQWKTISLNVKSQNAAVRLGFTHEGTLRALIVLPPGKQGIRPGRPGVRFAERMQRDTWMGSVTWYEWEDSVRDHVDRLMARKS